MAEFADMKGLFSLEGKVAVVTGGGGILGQHFCAGLAQVGATVIVADLNLENAQETTNKIKAELGIETFPYHLDVAIQESISSFIAAVVKTHGRIDVLHNNAASKSSNLRRFFDSVETFDMDVWNEIMSVNVDGLFMMARAVGAVMAEQESGGSIIQTASIYGISAPDQRIYEGSEYLGGPINTPAVYSASKAAVLGLSRHLATYWYPQGKKVRVNSITPGGVSSGQNGVFYDKYSNRVPMGRMALPHEMVGALVYLASDASSYVNGHNLVVDGGLSVW